MPEFINELHFLLSFYALATNDQADDAADIRDRVTSRSEIHRAAKHGFCHTEGCLELAFPGERLVGENPLLVALEVIIEIGDGLRSG